MIEQHLEAIVQRRHPRFGPLFRPMLLQNEPRLLFLPKEPGGSERGSPDQHAIDRAADAGEADESEGDEAAPGETDDAGTGPAEA